MVTVCDRVCILQNEFGEILNFSRMAEQAGKLTYMMLYFHIKIQQRVFQYYIKICNHALHENTIHIEKYY